VKTTVDIPDPVYRQLKGKAAVEGTSVKEIILRGFRLNYSLEGGDRGNLYTLR
jgi:hypothetical protein